MRGDYLVARGSENGSRGTGWFKGKKVRSLPGRKNGSGVLRKDRLVIGQHMGGERVLL